MNISINQLRSSIQFGFLCDRPSHAQLSFAIHHWFDHIQRTLYSKKYNNTLLLKPNISLN